MPILPPRGTGLKEGRAGERRGGSPRTEEERLERHLQMVDKIEVVIPDDTEIKDIRLSNCRRTDDGSLVCDAEFLGYKWSCEIKYENGKMKLSCTKEVF